ncbi:Forkhead-associated protein [Methanofollis liminatans DSM 4140]|uniref:Forkhead-associated protein n=1 Tax=Methanofollis liminatans DSM 4140 TaxID=28892 RepID=J0S2B9_9EURY|nr:FHA domain-containing protein [Methanofollis liminatans]EJG08051.1 Forkhead-associated protein [Methanofollis liminatans DSM 4140]
MRDGDDDSTLAPGQDLDFVDELSEYLDVLSSPTRLRILKIIERRPRDAKEISRAVGTSYENTKKHLNRLLLAGLIRKEAGSSAETVTGVHPVWKYSLVQGGLEMVIQNLGIFGNLGIAADGSGVSLRLREMKDRLSSAFFGGTPIILVVGGEEDGRTVPLRYEQYAVGRADAAGSPADGETIALAPSYAAVSRVSRPHCLLKRLGGTWHVKDAGSTGGTMVNTVPLRKNEMRPLLDGDLIDLARGPQGARLLFSVPPPASGEDGLDET